MARLQGDFRCGPNRKKERCLAWHPQISSFVSLRVIVVMMAMMRLVKRVVIIVIAILVAGIVWVAPRMVTVMVMVMSLG